MGTFFRPLLTTKPIVGIFGNGLSGKGAAHLCKKLHLPYEIIDERQHSQTPRFERYGVYVSSPGFPPNHGATSHIGSIPDYNQPLLCPSHPTQHPQRCLP